MTTKKPDWKRTERELAKMLGGKRIPVTGRQRGETPDIDHPLYSIEVKHKKKLPEWLHDAHDQAVQSSNKRKKLPVVVLHETGKAHKNDYVVLQMRDFLEITGEFVESDLPMFLKEQAE